LSRANPIKANQIAKARAKPQGEANRSALGKIAKVKQIAMAKPSSYKVKQNQMPMPPSRGKAPKSEQSRKAKRVSQDASTNERQRVKLISGTQAQSSSN
jgi:cobalamin biosynthesis protein CobD/CbiB